MSHNTVAASAALPDFRITNHGGIFLLAPVIEGARA
jgi:hypothetical protein